MERIKKIGMLTRVSSPKKEYECDICKDIGWVEKVNGFAPCKCQEVKKYREILENSGISQVFLKKTFDNYIVKTETQRKAKDKALQYVKEFENKRDTENNSIAFLKKVGAGKTHLSIAIANKLMGQGIGVRYMPYREIIIALKQNILDEEYYQKEINKYKNAPVLLIDDLYKGKITEADINIIYEIVNYRYLKSLPMIISCEYDTDKLLDFDEAIGSRIIEMSKGNIIQFDEKEKNYRLQK